MTELHHPQPTATQSQRRKFAVLVVLAFVIILLLWILTLPLNIGRSNGGTAGPGQLFHFIREYTSIGSQKIQEAQPQNENTNTQQ